MRLLNALLVALVLFPSCCVGGEISTPDSDVAKPAPAGLSVDGSSSKPEQSSLALGKTETSPEGSHHKSSRWGGNPGKFFLGAFVGLAGHETGHLISNWSLDTNPFAKSVHYGPIPWFTIEPGRPLSKREHYITASAGFTGQHIMNEWLLTKHPNLRKENQPFLKGIATFDFWLTIGYAATAFAGTGPEERDTKGMADSIGWSEESVGAMILVPTSLDVYRYKHPKAKWAKTVSRLSKVFVMGLAFKAKD